MPQSTISSRPQARICTTRTFTYRRRTIVLGLTCALSKNSDCKTAIICDILLFRQNPKNRVRISTLDFSEPAEKNTISSNSRRFRETMFSTRTGCFLSATCQKHTSRRRCIAFAKGKNIASSLLYCVPSGRLPRYARNDIQRVSVIVSR